MSKRFLLRLNIAEKVGLARAGTLAVAIPIILGVMSARSLHAQNEPGRAPKTSDSARVEFEVASVRSSSGKVPGLLKARGGTFTVEAVPVKQLIGYAYQTPLGLIQSAPGWADTDRYDIVAKYNPDADDSAVRQMVQMLLIERFRLAFHRQVKEAPIYTLTVAKTGARLRPAKENSIARLTPGATPGSGHNVVIKLVFESEPISALVGFLQNRLSNPIAGESLVVDKTGLEGAYDFTLTFNDKNPMQQADDSLPAVPDGPDLLSALEEQLGLRLDNRMGPVDMIIVDHLDKASAN